MGLSRRLVRQLGEQILEVVATTQGVQVLVHLHMRGVPEITGDGLL
jgi:hypothetical protein